MDKTFWVTVLAVGIVTAGAVLMTKQVDQLTTPLSENISGVEQQEVDTSNSGEWVYLIREHEGYVAVFRAQNSEQPEMVLDTPVKYLPDYDRAQLEEGIPVSDYAQLVTLIEDFIS